MPDIEVHGCDISDFLITKALARGIAKDRLRICDARKTGYPGGAFDYSYSIGSLEHFTEDGVVQTIAECNRITHRASFHQVPVSRSGKDEGWTQAAQSYFNNSVDWWLERFAGSYRTTLVFDSRWEDTISLGKWFVGLKP